MRAFAVVRLTLMFVCAASWWRNSAKPGLAAFGESSARGMTIIKQRFSEQMGRSTKTVDLDLQPRIEKLKSITADYAALSHAATAIANNLQSFAAVRVQKKGGNMMFN